MNSSGLDAVCVSCWVYTIYTCYINIIKPVLIVHHYLFILSNGTLYFATFLY